MVEPPPSPKPWRGRTWSNDSWRTSLTANLTPDESSQESASDCRGISAGFEGTMRVTAGNDDTVNSKVVVESGGYGSGGGRALGNGGSGGGNAADIIRADGRDESPADGRGKLGEGSEHANNFQEPARKGDIRGDGNSGVARSRVDGTVGTNSAVLAGGGLNGKRNDTTRGCLASPPSVPVPGGAFAPQHRRGYGGRKVEVRTVAFSTIPPQMFSPAEVHSEDFAGEETSLVGHPSPVVGKGKDSVRQREVAAGCVGQGGLASRGGDGDERDQGVKEKTEAANTGRWGTFSATSAEGQNIVGHVGGAHGVAGVAGGEKAGVDAKVVRGGCGVGCEGARATGPMLVSCAPVRANSTRLAVRQWRHMFLP